MVIVKKLVVRKGDVEMRDVNVGDDIDEKNDDDDKNKKGMGARKDNKEVQKERKRQGEMMKMEMEGVEREAGGS